MGKESFVKLLTRICPIITSNSIGAFFGSVPPKAGLEKCVAYFSKEAKISAGGVTLPAGSGGRGSVVKVFIEREG